MIELKNVSKELRGTPILSDINYTFNDATIYGIEGKNGVGKTMLLRAISGLMRVKGEVIVDGERLGDKRDFPSSMGLLIENNNLLLDRSGFQNLLLLSKIKHIATTEMIRSAIERVGLNPDDRRTVRKYSLGMKQRLAIAQAIFEQPKLILLDEPTNAIDGNGVEEIKQLLLAEKQRGATLIITSHIKEDLHTLSDVVLQMSAGEIVNETKTE